MTRVWFCFVWGDLHHGLLPLLVLGYPVCEGLGIHGALHELEFSVVQVLLFFLGELVSHVVPGHRHFRRVLLLYRWTKGMRL